MIKAASVGLGWWSDELAKSIQGKSRKIKIISCYSKSKKKRINFSKIYKTNHHDSYNSIIKDPNIDAVILTTPHSLHAKHAIQALQNKKHVFVEKPMATKYLDAKKMYLAAKKYNKVLSVGHNRRFSSVFDFINKLNLQKKNWQKITYRCKLFRIWGSKIQKKNLAREQKRKSRRSNSWTRHTYDRFNMLFWRTS